MIPFATIKWELKVEEGFWLNMKMLKNINYKLQRETNGG